MSAIAEIALLLDVADVHVAFDSPAGWVRAVNGAVFLARRGGHLAIVGESGSGKSVMSRSVMNLLPLSGVRRTGRISFNGHAMFELAGPSCRSVLGVRLPTYRSTR